ncbi:MAG: VOC family protein [Acidobacteriia bacterium]|nr:VOC family protein [Terriglobia bacterium]
MASSIGLNRRQVLTTLAAGAAAARKVVADTDGALHFVALDHVAIAVTDVDRAVAFYSRIFGNTVLKDNRSTRRYLKLGPCYVAIAPPAEGQPAHRVDHICVGIDGFEMTSVKRSLEALGLKPRETQVGWFVADPDGIQLQFFKMNSWNDLGATATAEQIPASSVIFPPAGLDHVLLRVSDLPRSEQFYAKLFGPVTQRNSNGRIFFQAGRSRIAVTAADATHPVGVDHFCVLSPKFDYDAVIKKLEAAGARTQPPEVAGAPEFHDPENILVQVMAPRTA